MYAFKFPGFIIFLRIAAMDPAIVKKKLKLGFILMRYRLQKWQRILHKIRVNARLTNVIKRLPSHHDCWFHCCNVLWTFGLKILCHLTGIYYCDIVICVYDIVVLAIFLLVETNPFSELVVIFTDYALRISLGTFSILLITCLYYDFIFRLW